MAANEKCLTSDLVDFWMTIIGYTSIGKDALRRIPEEVILKQYNSSILSGNFPVRNTPTGALLMKIVVSFLEVSQVVIIYRAPSAKLEESLALVEQARGFAAAFTSTSKFLPSTILLSKALVQLITDILTRAC